MVLPVGHPYYAQEGMVDFPPHWGTLALGKATIGSLWHPGASFHLLHPPSLLQFCSMSAQSDVTCNLCRYLKFSERIWLFSATAALTLSVYLKAWYQLTVPWDRKNVLVFLTWILNACICLKVLNQMLKFWLIWWLKKPVITLVERLNPTGTTFTWVCLRLQALPLSVSQLCDGWFYCTCWQSMIRDPKQAHDP